jgi:hypothetical protein
MKKKLQLLGVFSMLSLVFIVGIKTTFDGFFGFYYENKPYHQPLVYKTCNSIVNSTPVSLFLYYTGFDTGYGFFAPNVASDFVIMFHLKDKEGNLIEQTIMPNFKQKESMVRYTSMYSMFLDRISVDSNKIDKQFEKYLDVVLKQVALNVKKDYPNAAQVKAQLLLYDYPELKRFRQGDRKENGILIAECEL